MFFAASDWWMPKDSYLVYLYLLAVFAWLISCKQNDWVSSHDVLFMINLKMFWVFNFLMQMIQFCLVEKYKILLTLILKLFCSLILIFYALNKEEKDKRSKVPKLLISRLIKQTLAKFEENFYVRVIFLGRDYENFLRKEIELTDIEIHSNMNMNLSFTDVKKKEKGFVKKLNEKNYLNEHYIL